MNKFLKSLLFRINSALFRYQVKTGMILCVGGLPDEDNNEDETVVIDNEEVEEQQDEQQQTEEEQQDQQNQDNNEEGEEVVIQIEGEENNEEDESVTSAPQWVKDLRKQHREAQKRIKELETQVSAVTGAAQKPVQLGAKPTLEGCDYDAEKFEKELEAWHEQKRKAEEAENEQRRQQEQQNKAWQETLSSYSKAKTELKVKDFEDAEDLVKDTLSVTQQGIILQGCKNPALVVYALGKNPKKAKQLAEIKDPVKYAFAVADLERQLKVTNRKAPPAPEKTVRGNASISGSVDSQLERLRAEAEKTGDYSKVMAYKNQQRNKGGK